MLLPHVAEGSIRFGSRGVMHAESSPLPRHAQPPYDFLRAALVDCEAHQIAALVAYLPVTVASPDRICAMLLLGAVSGTDLLYVNHDGPRRFLTLQACLD